MVELTAPPSNFNFGPLPIADSIPNDVFVEPSFNERSLEPVTENLPKFKEPPPKIFVSFLKVGSLNELPQILVLKRVVKELTLKMECLHLVFHFLQKPILVIQ